MKNVGKRIGLLLLLLLALLLGGELWASYHWLEVPEEEVAASGLTGEVRLAVLGDLHTSQFGDDQEKLVEAVLEEDPDVVLMIGDMVNEDAEDPSGLLTLIRSLSGNVPVYYALGNHELIYLEIHPDFEEELVQAGAVVLEQSYEDAELAGQKIRIGGMYDYAFNPLSVHPTEHSEMDPDVLRFLTEFEQTDRYRILLAHRPDSFIFGGAGEAWDIDLVVSGHVHGGQVRLPGIGGLWAPEQGWFPAYVEGIHDLGRVTMAITRGLGSQREWLPRLGNRPEILVVVLKPSG